jgi:histidinol-phosphate aminotransferase
LTSKTYNLSSNENPLGPSPLALKAVRSSLQDINAYRFESDKPLREVLSQAFQHELTRDQFLPANGGLELIDLICRAFLKPGDECIVSSPTLPAHGEFARLSGARVIDAPLDHRSFEPDIPAILKAMNEKTRLIFLASPNDPTGSIVTRGQIDRLLLHLLPNIFIVCDQSYHQYVSDPQYAHAAEHVKKERRVIGLHSFSHAYGLAGMRLAYAFSTPTIIRTLRQYQRPFMINSLTMEAGIAALADQGFVNAAARISLREKKWYCATFEKMGLRFWPGEANFLLLRAPYDSSLFAGQLLQKGFIVREGGEFGARGCIRITMGTRPTNKAFIRAMQAVLDDDR